jgi:hypothetical protein
MQRTQKLLNISALKTKKRRDGRKGKDKRSKSAINNKFISVQYFYKKYQEEHHFVLI